MCPFVHGSFTLSLQVLVAPKGEGGLGVKLSSEARTGMHKFVFLIVFFASNYVSQSFSNDMWSLVLVPVLDEKPCQQLL